MCPARRPPPLPPPDKHGNEEPRRLEPAAPSPAEGGGGARLGPGPRPAGAATAAASLFWQRGPFSTSSSFTSFATLLIEHLHVQFKRPSVGQAGEKANPS